MIGSLALGAVAALASGAALLLAPQGRNRILPHPLFVTFGFVLVFVLQASQMHSFYDGGQGDNRYQLAIVNQVQQGNLLGDYFYRGVPAHYPPLYFWIAGGLGKLLGLDAEATIRWMPALSIVLAAAGLAWLARRIGSDSSAAIVLVLAIGSFAAYYLFSYPPDRGLWMVLLAKPQQFLGAILCLAIPLATASSVHRPLAIVFSVSLLGAALALTMPLFFPMAAVAAIFVTIFLAGQDLRLRSSLALFAALSAALLIASPYLGPVLEGLLSRRGAGGYIYWQSLASLDLSHWTLGFGFGVPMVLALISLREFIRRQDPGQRRCAAALIAATAIAWAVYLSAFLTYPLFGWSLFSWWATVPALLGTCSIAAWGISSRIASLDETIGLDRRVSKQLATKVVTAGVVAAFALSWSARTDDFLAYSYGSIDPDFRRAAELLEESTSENSSFIGGQEELIISGLSGRGLVYVAHAFYASPLADSERRKAEVVALLHDPTCQKVFDLQNAYGMEAIALARASRWIPRLMTSSTIALEEGISSVENDDLVLADLVAEKKGDPERVSKTILYKASPSLESLPCIEKVMDTQNLVLFVVANR